MKLKATNPLVLFVGALAIGLAGCADDVIITEPPPPPPPPPPESAEISIVSIVNPDDGTEIGQSQADAVSGVIGVAINFDTGGFEAATLDVFVDSDKVPCQTFSGQAAVGFSADQQRVQCLINTDEGIGSCTGSTLLGRFENGTHTISATLTLQDGSSVTATRAEPLTFGNSNSIIIVPNDIGPRVVGLDAQGWWGGPRDLTWFACPVIFSASLDDICDITATATDSNVNPLDDMILGGPSGTTSSETSQEPFMYTASYRDVAGVPVDADPLNEDRVEDDDVSVTPTTVLACDGTDITSSFPGSLIGDTRPIDSTAPLCSVANVGVGDGECEPVLDGADMFVLQNGLYSDGSIVLDDVMDFGVGIASVIVDAYDFADGVAANQTLFLADVGDVADVPEDDGCGSDGSTDIATQLLCIAAAEAGVPVDAYFAFVSEVKDLLDNALGDGDNDLQILAVFDNSEEFGTDFTSPETDEFEPPTDDPTFVWNPDLGVNYSAGSPALIDLSRLCPSDDSALCESIMWEAVDPDLASGDDPSGVENGSCVPGPGPSCADDDANAHVVMDGNLIEGEITAAPASPPASSDNEDELLGAASPAADMYEAFFCAGGLIGAECDGTDDGSYAVDIFTSDKAVKENNVTVDGLSFTLDTNPPVIGFGGITGLNSSNAATVEFVLTASVVDRNGDGTALTMVTVDVSIEDITNGLADGDCTTLGDQLFLESEVLVSPNDDTTGATVVVDVTSQVNANGGNMNQTFTASNQGGNLGLGDYTYCFLITADDGAERKDGTDDGTDINSVAGKDFTWQ